MVKVLGKHCESSAFSGLWPRELGLPIQRIRVRRQKAQESKSYHQDWTLGWSLKGRLV